MELPDHLRDPEMVPFGGAGRTFSTSRRVRWGDADHTGQLRLDGAARYLQDLGNDDTRDVDHDPAAPWIVRRTTIAVHRPIGVGEEVTGTTFAGGLGRSWAERRTSLVTQRGGRIEAAALWIFVDPVSHRPTRLTPAVIDVYAEAAAGRKVAARLRHGRPDDAPGALEARPWPLRSTDIDGLGHVNNAATWEAVEDELARRKLTPVVAELEYGGGIDPADEVELRSVLHAGTGSESFLALWLMVDGDVRASAQVRATPR